MGLTDKKQTSHDWLVAHVGYAGEGCLIWPFSAVDGYGEFGHRRKMHYAHRYMCELVHGPAPSPQHMAAHTCGNGNKGCVHPQHVQWKTWSENAYDRTAHGTQANGKRGKLTLEQAERIRALRGQKTQAEIAEMFGITRSNVGYVQRGRTHTNPFKGVSRVGKRFGAVIKIGEKSRWLGAFDTPEQASAAYQAELAAVLAANSYND